MSTSEPGRDESREETSATSPTDPPNDGDTPVEDILPGSLPVDEPGPLF